MVSSAAIAPLLTHRNRSIVCTSVYASALLLRLSDAELQHLIEKNLPETIGATDRLFPLMELKRIEQLQSSIKSRPDLPASTRSLEIDSTCLSPHTVDVCGILLPRSKQTSTQTINADPFILTQTTAENMRTLALSLSLATPILLYGPAASGKPLYSLFTYFSGKTHMI